MDPETRFEKIQRWVRIAFSVCTVLIRYFWMTHSLKSPPGLKAPIFIVGCKHSGTSLLLAMLDSHSAIFGVPFESRAALRGERILKIVVAIFNRWAFVEGKKRWIEKSPSHIHHIERLLKICPDAKIILMIRDGRDVCLSIKRRTGSFERGIKRWVFDNREGQKHWNRPELIVLKYEDLIENPKKEINNILNFLGESFEKSVLNHSAKKRKIFSSKFTKPVNQFGKNHNQYRNWQINQPIFDGRGKWKELSEEEIEFINKYAGEMLSEYGYK